MRTQRIPKFKTSPLDHDAIGVKKRSDGKVQGGGTESRSVIGLKEGGVVVTKNQ